MSATSPKVATLRAPLATRLARAATAGGLPVRAFLGSRLLVFAAGTAGALAVPRRLDWTGFDPARVSAHLGAVGNVLAAPAVRWDAVHYLAIAAHGYTAPGDTVFFPLYPLLIQVLGTLVGSDAAAGMVISAVSLLVALKLLHRLASIELGGRAADTTVLLLAFAPLSFFFTAVYTEALFLALSLGCLYSARQGRWRLAAVLGALAAVTRITGVLLLIPLAIMRLRLSRRLDPRSAWILIVPASLAGWLALLAAQGFGPLAPVLQQTAAQHGHRLSGPIDTIVMAARAAYGGLRSFATVPLYQPSFGAPLSAGAENVLLLVVLAIAVAALVAAFRRLPLAYGTYALATLLVCIWSPVPDQPLRSLDRYTLTMFPLWMAAGAWIAERRLTRSAVLIGAGLLAFYTFEFASWAWIA